MTSTHWLTASAIALLLAASWQLDGPSDTDAAQASAADLRDARQQARAEFIARARAGADTAREVPAELITPTRYASAEAAQ